jgi:hypothetical protein
MATPRKSASAQHHEGETGQEKRWWRHPGVIAAFIAAGAAIVVAIIGGFVQFTGPKSKPSEPTRIEQQTYGSGSPAVGQTGGNVTIQQHGGGEKP